MRKVLVVVAAAAVAGNGSQRGSLVGGTGAVVTGVAAAGVAAAAAVVMVMVMVAVVVAEAEAVGDSLAGSFPLAPAPAWHTKQRSQTGERVSQMG